MRYPLENLTDKEFEDLVALICEQILGMGTIVFSEGTDGGKDARFNGKANTFPSSTNPWNGKIIIQAKLCHRPNASCSDSDFKGIINNQVLPAIHKLQDKNEIDYYLLFTNRKLSGIQDTKIEDLFEYNTNIENHLIALERIELWLKEFPFIVKTMNLNKLLLPIEFQEQDIKDIIIGFNNADIKQSGLSEIPKSRDISNKNEINNLSKDYFDNSIKKNLIHFEKINRFLEEGINIEFLRKYENTIADINDEILIHRQEYDRFEEVINYLYQYILVNNKDLNGKRALIRIFFHYMYYNCDIGKNE